MGESKGVAFGLYLSCVDGKPVHRFGSKELIGATRDPKQSNKIVYSPKTIVGIPVDEARKYGREYARLVEEGDLKSHDAKAYAAQQAQRTEAAETREKLAER